jgi:Uma2 family endonuclease
MASQLKNGAATMPQSQDGRISYEEFLQIDQENNHIEWVDGRVVPMAPVSSEHQDLGVFLITLLGAFVEAHDLGTLLYDPFQMKTGADLPGRAPDLILVSKRNLSRLKKNHLQGPADLVVEIISPSNRSVDRRDKYHEYQKGGVREFWLLDPERKEAQFYILGRDRIYHPANLEEDIRFHSTVLKGLWIEVSWLWSRPRPTVFDIFKKWKLS